MILWDLEFRNRFRSAYKRIHSNLAARVDDVIRELVSSDKPELLGIPKTTGLFAWELGRACRVTYQPDYSNGVIIFHRVCSHKEVYDR